MTKQSEQPENRRRPRAPHGRAMLQDAANAYELSDATAIKALHGGVATAEQQQRALKWILESACGLPAWPYVVGDPDQTHIHLGRHFVGQQIMKLLTTNLASIKPREPNADQHEPSRNS